MTYRVELTDRATRDLRHLYQIVNAEYSIQAHAWFNRLQQAILSLDENPARCPIIHEYANLRHLLFGRRRNVYRVIFFIDESARVVTVLHIRHGARGAFQIDADA